VASPDRRFTGEHDTTSAQNAVASKKATRHVARAARSWCVVRYRSYVSSDRVEQGTGTIRRLVGVYNANGTVVGELAYLIRARMGGSHCALCDVTHGLVRERPEWEACRTQLRAPFDTYHVNDQPGPVRAAYDGRAPVVLAETDTAMIPLLGTPELSACAGSMERLTIAIDDAVEAPGLKWCQHEQQA